MKYLLTFLFSFLILLYINGLRNYNKAITCGENSEGTDSAICECNQKYGFNLDWDEIPSNTEIMLSNF